MSKVANTNNHKDMNTKKPFRTIFLLEVWERFGFYGMAAILLIYMIEHMGFSDSKATFIWGAFTALVFASPTIGGWIGDKFIGSRRAVFVGAGLLFLGYLGFTLPLNEQVFLYPFLALIVVGNGFFKSNAANLVRIIYKNDRCKLDSAFTVYYMSVNIGSAVSLLLVPYVKEHYGWHWSFVLSAVGMFLGIAQAWILRRTIKHIGSEFDDRKVPVKHTVLIVIGSLIAVGIFSLVLRDIDLAKLCFSVISLATILLFLWLIVKVQKSERAGLMVAFVLCLQVVGFMIYYQQMATSLTIFALRNVDTELTFFGLHLFTFSAPQYMALNGIWILILSPILSWLYSKVDKEQDRGSIPLKFAIGFFCLVLGFGIFAISGNFAVDYKVSSWFMIAGYGFYSLGELFVGGLGLAMIARYVPKRLSAMMMGIYLLSVGIAQYLGAMVADVQHLPSGQHISPAQTLPLYTNLFKELAWWAVAATIISLILLPMLKKLSINHAASEVKSEVST